MHLCGVVTAYSGSSGIVILDVAVGGPYHPPLWFCHRRGARGEGAAPPPAKRHIVMIHSFAM